MKRDTLFFVASALIVGFIATAVAVQCVAAETQATVADVKFACSVHGPGHMQLTLSLDKSAAATRTIEFIGQTNGAKWGVKVDGQDVPTDNATAVKVHTGDTIKWSVAALRHGVAFADKDLAQAMLTFDTIEGQPLEDLGTTLNSQAWMDFGSKLWGRIGVPAGTDPIVIVSCKVK